MTDKTQPTAHGEITAPISADLRGIDGGALPAPITYMTEDRACKWAWDQVRKEVGTEGWTTSDSCNFYGFFMWGWHYRGQYETQRPAAPPAPAAVAVPAPLAAGMKVAADLVQEQADLYIAEHAETDPDTGAVIWHHREYGFDWHNGLEELAQKLLARAALTAAPAQAQDDRAAFKAYLQECDDCEIVPDVAGAFHAAWQKRAAPAQAVAVPADAQAPEQWIDDPHDIEQGMMLNPKWVRAQEHATQLASQGLEPSPPVAVTGPVEWPATCDGLEQEAWEAWARVQRFDMVEHPMHYLFLNERTDAARQGWKGGLVYAVEQMKQRVHVVEAKGDERTDALQDSAYAAGMLSGWNLCVADDHATFSKVRGERMTGAARVANAARAAAPAQAQEDARDAERFRAMANAAITEDAVFGECLERLGGDCKTIDDIRAVFDAARAAQGGAL